MEKPFAFFSFGAFVPRVHTPSARHASPTATLAPAMVPALTMVADDGGSSSAEASAAIKMSTTTETPMSLDVGDATSDPVGDAVDKWAGGAMGDTVEVGFPVGTGVGGMLGAADGANVGDPVATAVGAAVGAAFGTAVGTNVAHTFESPQRPPEQSSSSTHSCPIAHP